METLAPTDTAARVHQIADCLTTPAGKLTSFGYSSGLLGEALFWTYYACFADDDAATNRAQTLLMEAIQRVTQPYRGRNFPKELAEFGQFMEYANANNVIAVDTNALLGGADALLANALTDALDHHDFDPYSGAIGPGQYFLSRMASHDSARHRVSQLVTGLRRMAVADGPDKLFWPSKLFGDDRVYLGLSHGTAAVIVCLCRAAEAGIQVDSATDTIRRAVTYLLAQQQDYKRVGAFYPDVVGDAPQRTRLGLCYGDLGVAYCLLRAGRVLNDPCLEQKALDVFAFSATRRSLVESGIRDAGILYGAGGAALLFDKAYALTGQPVLDDAARYWYERIPDFAVHRNQTAGYQGVFNQHLPHTNLAFMEGIAGIGATLMKAAQRDNYSFDELIWLL